MSDIQDILKSKQQLLHNKFINVCKKGDLDTAIEIYNKYYIEPNKFQTRVKNKFFSFLKIAQPLLPPPVLNLSEVASSILKESALYNQEHIINFFLEEKHFLKHLNSSEEYKVSILSNLLDSSMLKGNIGLMEKILPLIKEKNDIFYKNITPGFEFSCDQGNLDVIKCLFKDDAIRNQKLEIYENKYNSSNSYNLIHRGFQIACNTGNTELLRFFTDSSQLNNAININEDEDKIYVDSFKTIEFFIMELNIDKQCLLKKIQLGFNFDSHEGVKKVI